VPTASEMEEFTARGIKVVPGEVACLVADGRLTGVELADGRVIERTAVFVRPINTPHPDGLLASRRFGFHGGVIGVMVASRFQLGRPA
jgi:hypothetical protein